MWGNIIIQIINVMKISYLRRDSVYASTRNLISKSEYSYQDNLSKWKVYGYSHSSNNNSKYNSPLKNRINKHTLVSP